MRQSDLALEKYRVTQSGYFRLSTKVALGMVITDGNPLLYKVFQRKAGKSNFQ